MLDNGAFHKGQNLIIPENIALLFIPPFSPELNPAEKIWQKMKRTFSRKLHKTLDNVSKFIITQVKYLQSNRLKISVDTTIYFYVEIGLMYIK